MTTTLTVEQKIDLVNRHARFETTERYDEAWETMHHSAVYDFLPAGIRLRGKEPIYEYWQRAFQITALQPLGEAVMRRWIRDEDLIIISEWPVKAADGSVQTTRGIGIFTFIDDKIATETVIRDHILEPHMAPVFNEEFLSRPGVERITT